MSISSFLLNLFFPRFCINCQKEGNYLCQDCLSLIDFLPYWPYQSGNLKGVFSAVPYNNFIIKKLLSQFKYEPYIKELAKPLAFLIIHRLQTIENPLPPFSKIVGGRPSHNFILAPVPLTKKRQRKRGFNQAEEIAKKLSSFLEISLISDCLIKIKETIPQVELTAEERKENIKGTFLIKNGGLVKDKKILLVDDVFTTGSTMEECAQTLKEAGAKEVWGITAARE